VTDELRQAVSVRVTFAIQADGAAAEETVRLYSRTSRAEAQALYRTLCTLVESARLHDPGKEAVYPLRPGDRRERASDER